MNEIPEQKRSPWLDRLGSPYAALAVKAVIAAAVALAALAADGIDSAPVYMRF